MVAHLKHHLLKIYLLQPMQQVLVQVVVAVPGQMLDQEMVDLVMLV
jgi:hypothetical protein